MADVGPAAVAAAAEEPAVPRAEDIDMGSPSDGAVDQAFLDALPADLRAEMVAAQAGRLPQPASQPQQPPPAPSPQATPPEPASAAAPAAPAGALVLSFPVRITLDSVVKSKISEHTAPEPCSGSEQIVPATPGVGSRPMVSQKQLGVRVALKCGLCPQPPGSL